MRNGSRPDAYGALATAVGEETWAAPTFRYVIDRYDRAGRWRARYIRHLQWFSEKSRSEPTPPRMNAIEPTADGRVWILLARPNPDWSPPEAPAGGGRGETRAVQLSAAQVIDRFDHVIELLDPATGHVVTSARLADRYVGGFIDEEHLFTLREDEIGEVSIEIWHLRLVHPGP